MGFNAQGLALASGRITGKYISIFFFFFARVRVEKVSNLIELEESSKFSLETSNHEFPEQ